MRRGKQFYAQHYDSVIALHNQGKSVKEIAAQLNISYSCVYHWVKGLRKPETGSIIGFVEYLRSKGPTPASEIKNSFEKHNEFFLRAHGRGFHVKRLLLQRKLGDYATWYYLEGQENQLRERVSDFMKKYNETRRKLGEKLEEINLADLIK